MRKTTNERQGKEGKVSVRYALRAENEGTKLTKFVSQADWEALEAPLRVARARTGSAGSARRGDRPGKARPG